MIAPKFLYGTAWKEERTEALTLQALDAGFRAIDTANQRKHYFEAAVGAGIVASKIARPELFIQSKFTYARGQDHRLPYDKHASPGEQVTQSFASSLEHLHTDYLDSYVLHGPELTRGLTAMDWDVWRAMSRLFTDGKTRALGVSNINYEQLVELVKRAEHKPSFVQNRCYARTGWDADVRAFCRDHAITYQGFSLLTANQRELALPAIGAIATRVKRTIPTVIFAFCTQVGMLPLTGSSNSLHLKHDLACVEIQDALTAADIATIESIGLA